MGNSKADFEDFIVAVIKWIPGDLFFCWCFVLMVAELVVDDLVHLVALILIFVRR